VERVGMGKKARSSTRKVGIELWEQGSKEFDSEQSQEIDGDGIEIGHQKRVKTLVRVIDLKDFTLPIHQHFDVEFCETDNFRKVETLKPNEVEEEAVPSFTAQDIKLERIESNDSYMNWFITNAVLNEDLIIAETPLHEETITSFRQNASNFEEAVEGSKHINTILKNSPVLIKPIISFLLSPSKISTNEKIEEVKGQDFLHTDNEKSNLFLTLAPSSSIKTGEEELFRIDPYHDNLIHSEDQMTVYCKLIDFYTMETHPQVAFLFSLLSLDSPSKSSQTYHDYTSGTVCNLTSFGVLKWGFQYLKGNVKALF
jgi:hypothetical protein